MHKTKLLYDLGAPTATVEYIQLGEHCSECFNPTAELCLETLNQFHVPAWITTKLAIFLTTVLERIPMPYVLRDSKQVITTIEGMDVTPDDILLSADVTSLYTMMILSHLYETLRHALYLLLNGNQETINFILDAVRKQHSLLRH
ncbi:Uncharacterized protein PBTT_07956 [Plasmodiophora brassicae]